MPSSSPRDGSSSRRCAPAPVGGREAVSLTVGTGEHVVFGPGHVHDLVNEGPGPALSVHVYSPALRTMTFFDQHADRGLVAVRTEEYHEGILVRMTRTADQLVTDARRRIDRIVPGSLAGVVSGGGLVVDIRPEAQRVVEGELPDAVVVERNVLEWRLDPRGRPPDPQVRDHGQQVVVVCSEGYASSLAAASLVELGFVRAADLEGGYRAWRAWADLQAAAR